VVGGSFASTARSSDAEIVDLSCLEEESAMHASTGHNKEAPTLQPVAEPPCRPVLALDLSALRRGAEGGGGGGPARFRMDTSDSMTSTADRRSSLANRYDALGAVEFHRLDEAAMPVSSQPGEECSAPGSEGSGPAVNEAIGAVLQLFYLCNPAKDATICRADLKSVLHQHLGRDEDVASLLRLLAEGGRGDTPPERYDFLSYWHGMERFFMEAGSWPQPTEQAGAEDMLRGMQRFRDGTLQLWRRQDQHEAISSRELLALLREIQESSQDTQYWQEVMHIVPQEEGFGLTLLEVSETVCAWLREYLKAESEDREDPGAGPLPPEPQVTSPPFSLRQDFQIPPAEESLASPSPTVLSWLAPLRSRRRGSAVSSDTGGVPLAAELQRAQELCEALTRAVDDKNAAAQRALSQLTSVHESLARMLQSQELELGSLRRSSATFGEKRRQLEAELARAHDILEEDRDVAAQRDEQRKRADALERELRELKDHCALSSQELDTLRAKSADAERERVDTQRRDWQWRDRCHQLEQAADTAEGQARWMNSEVQRQAVRLSTTEAQAQLLRQDAVAWRWRCLAQAAFGAACSREESAARALRRRQLRCTGAPPTRRARSTVVPAGSAGAVRSSLAPAGPEDLQAQVRVQRAEVRRLRALRDELLAAAGAWQASRERDGEDGSASPRQAQVQYRCTFLAAQLRALLRHTHEVEQVLDNLHDAQLGGAHPSPDVRRRLSIQQVQEEGEAVFNELSERLYTLEVQKADADQELRQLQARAAEQDRQLRAGRLRRDELLAELGAARQAAGQEVICQKPSGVADLQACCKADFYTRSHTSVTSETRSVTSGAGGGGADACGFFAPVHGTLRSSPKVSIGSTVKKVVAVSRLAGGHGSGGGPHA